MKNATLSVRVENDLKVEAESILQKLGIPVSVLINSLYRQIIYKRGIPFSITIPNEPKTLDDFTESELKRLRWYDIILYMTMMVEVFYREFEDKGQYIWAKEQFLRVLNEA